MSYLHRFPIDTLKIDRSFVSGVGNGLDTWEIVRAIAMMAHALGMDVIAEGVETKEQLARIKALKCKYVQRYFFSKPVDSATASELIAHKLSNVHNQLVLANVKQA